MPFEELEHTADVKMRITASDFLSLFQESSRALASVLYGDYPREPSVISAEIEACGKDEGELAVNYLSELLFLMETEYLVPQDIELAGDSGHIKGIVRGVEFDRAKHAGGIEVKGISYSGMSLTKTNTGFELVIIFDI